MGHAISALVLAGPFKQQRAAGFDLKPILSDQGITVFPLAANYCDYWDSQLDLSGALSDRPILDCTVVHYIACQIADAATFAVIETDYFGGSGDQAAVVYRGTEQIMEPQVARRGPINNALKQLGVSPRPFRDAFATIGLGRFRNWDDLFDKYDTR
jgi:hypothetical protein